MAPLFHKAAIIIKYRNNNMSTKIVSFVCKIILDVVLTAVVAIVST